MLLRLTHLGSGHHLHRFRDLGGAADGFDPAPYISRVRHYKLPVTIPANSHDVIARSF
jgi:hypothetical protein